MTLSICERLECRRLLATGSLDAEFGQQGVARESSAATQQGFVETMADGRIVTARTVSLVDRFQLWVTRFNADGSMDTTFGGEANGQSAGIPPGTVLVSGDRVPVEVTDLELGANGEIFMIGTSSASGSSTGGFAVVKLDADGSFDSTFGGPDNGSTGAIPGVAVHDFSRRSTSGQMAIAPDGRIAVVGTTAGPGESAVVVVFSADGSLDENFSNDGVNIWGFGFRTNESVESFQGTAVEWLSGDLVLGGSRTVRELERVPDREPQWHVARLDQTAGPRFSRFIDNHDFSNTNLTDIALLSDGTMLISGATAGGDIIVGKVNADTNADLVTSFGDNGFVTTLLPDVASTFLSGTVALSPLPDGRFYVLSRALSQFTNEQRLFISRYANSGAPDPTWGGLVTVDAGDTIAAADLALAGDHPIVLSTITSGAISQPSDAALELRKFLGSGGRLAGRALLVSGTSGDDSISILAGDDGINLVSVGGGVPDETFSNSAFDQIQMFAFSGDDSVTVGSGVRGTYVNADEGNDTITGGDGDDSLHGGNGNNLIFGEGGNDFLKSGDGADTFFGGNGNDELRGGAGDDALNGGAGKDRLFGQQGNDRLYGRKHADALDGGPGNDLLFGDGGRDKLFGSDGDDRLVASDGLADFIDGGADNDTAAIDEDLDAVLNVETT